MIIRAIIPNVTPTPMLKNSLSNNISYNVSTSLPLQMRYVTIVDIYSFAYTKKLSILGIDSSDNQSSISAFCDSKLLTKTIHTVKATTTQVMSRRVLISLFKLPPIYNIRNNPSAPYVAGKIEPIF